MSQKVVVVDSSGLSGISDSDSDLDLTDTNLLPSEDEVLKKYTDMNHKLSENEVLKKYIKIPAVESTKDAPIVVFSDDDRDDLNEIELNLSPAATSDPPDYESPEEDDTNDPKQLDYESPEGDDTNDPKQLDYESPEEDDTNDPKQLDYESAVEDDTIEGKADHFDRSSNADCEGLAYDELLAMCGQNAGNEGYSRAGDYDDDEMFHDAVTNKVKVERFKTVRVAPYNIKGKGKQLVSGTSRYKSSANTAGKLPATSRNKELVFRDSAQAICYGDRPIDMETQPKEEEKPVPPPPMLCQACSKAESHNSMVQCCDSHVVCTKCVEDAAKHVLVGEKKGSVGCPRDKCSSSVPLSELRKALPAIVLDLLEDKWNKETLEAIENMKDSVTCPGCGFKAVLDMNLKHFLCLGCNQAYCRYCDYKWKERKNHDLCIRTKQWTSTVTGNIVNIPAQWSDSTTDSTSGKTESFKAEELASSGEEFSDVVCYMNKYMHATIKKIFRIQNERLWEKYSLTRSHMVADLGELNVNEKRLFHGTYRDVIEPICKEGFDWRLCGKHGTVYGQGTYFAKSPVTSHRYSAAEIMRSRNVPGHSGFPMFFHGTKPPQHYKPALRFGAPITTQSSGLTFGTPISTFVPTTDACSQQSTIGAPGTIQSSGFRFGNTSISQNTGFNFGTTSVERSVFRFTAGASGAAPAQNVTLSSLSTAGGTGGNPLSVAVGSYCNQSSVISSTTDTGARQMSCTNCIFCSHTKKPKNSDDAVTNIPKQNIPDVTPSMDDIKNGMLVKNLISGSLNQGDVNNDAVNIHVQRLERIREAHKRKKELIKEHKMQKRKALLSHGHNIMFVTPVPPTSPFGFSGGGGPSVSGIFGGSSNPNGGGGNGVGNNRTGGNGAGSAWTVETDSNNSIGDEYFMFLARVLVGRSCTGTHDMRRPGKDNEGHDTHSAVNSVHRPSVFVIFDNTQCYPEYIIQYST